MKTTIDKKTRKVFRKLCRKERNLQIVNASGGSVNLFLLEIRKEEIENLILEMNGNIIKGKQSKGRR